MKRAPISCPRPVGCIRRPRAQRRIQWEHNDRQPLLSTRRGFATEASPKQGGAKAEIAKSGDTSPPSQSKSPSPSQNRTGNPATGHADQADVANVDWDRDPNMSISNFSDLPYKDFGYNQHMQINEDFKEALRQILWQFRAPIRYAFAYGSGVFPQSAQPAPLSSHQLHPKTNKAISTVQGGSGKMIDFIFGVTYTQHWHDLNLQQHRDHYSTVGSLGSYAVSKIQDSFGAGVYFNPYVTSNGTLIKYGVVNIETLCDDLSNWSTLYLAGRLQKPVKILRDHPQVRLANQINLISALRTALLLLPERFTEKDLYQTIAGISYLGDPRMAFPTENPKKVENIVKHQLPKFRVLYGSLIADLPNVNFTDPITFKRGWVEDPTANALLTQDMDPLKRGNMVRRLPKAFREKLYFAFQSKYQIPGQEFNEMLKATDDDDPKRVNRRQGGKFEQRIAQEDEESLRSEVRSVIKKTISWPSTVQSLKGVVTTGFRKSWRYLSEKNQKHLEGSSKPAETTSEKKASSHAKESGTPSVVEGREKSS